MARPDAAATAAFRQVFHHRVRARFRVGAALAARRLPEAAAPARAVLTGLDLARRWQPELFTRQHQLASGLAADDLVRARAGLEGLVALAGTDLYRDACQWGRVTVDPVDVEALAVLAQVAPERADLRPPSAAAASRATRWVTEAVRVLCGVDPDMAAECELLVAQLRYHAGGGADALTSARWFGRLYLRLPEPGDPEPVLHLLDHLTHEASHLALHLRMAVDPLLTNGARGGFAAPIRPDPRPLSGVFHAMFVLARVTRVMARLTARDRRPATRQARDTQRALFENGYRTVVEHAALTPVGRRLVADCRSMVDEALG